MKVYAQTTFNAMSAADYGIEPLEPVTTEESIIAVVAKIFGAIIVPVALLVGIIVYFIKGKSEVWKKILITIGIVVIYIAFAVIINNIWDK